MAEKRGVIQRQKDTTELQWQVDMRMELDLLNVSFKSLLRVGTGKLPDTCDTANIGNKCLPMGYQFCCMTSWRTSINETKTHPTIHIHRVTSINWRLPKLECLKRLYVMPKGDKFQGLIAKKDDVENPAR